MLETLRRAEAAMPLLLREEDQWQSLFIDYHPPIVERLWRPWEDGRIYLHRIWPCRPRQALYHRHPWPSAIKLVAGGYEMGIGSGEGDRPPPIVATLVLCQGSSYEMVDPHGWHYVAPMPVPNFSLMVTGKPWEHAASKGAQQLSSLSESKRRELFTAFQHFYP